MLCARAADHQIISLPLAVVKFTTAYLLFYMYMNTHSETDYVTANSLGDKIKTITTVSSC